MWLRWEYRIYNLTLSSAWSKGSCGIIIRATMVYNGDFLFAYNFYSRWAPAVLRQIVNNICRRSGGALTMPLQHGPNTSPLSFYWDLPPITRSLVTSFVGLRAVQALGILPVPQLTYLSWTAIFSHWQVNRQTPYRRWPLQRECDGKACIISWSQQCDMHALLLAWHRVISTIV